jgi:meso-butanediol dehydrogenase/(S,S)-butanediol dehydrogenase/diacetyl reductase
VELGEYDLLTGKTAVITGGTSGIGEATVKLFAKNEANIVFIGIEEDLGGKVLDDLNSEGIGNKVHFKKLDVSQQSDIIKLVKFTEFEFGGCDILFNNAGIHMAGKLLETTPDEFDRIIAVDLKGVYLCCYYFLPMMLKKGKGEIINMSSVSGIAADYSMAAYNAAKGAVTNLTRAIAIDYADQGIRANAICPGAVRTEMLEYTFRKMPQAERLNREAYPTHTFATPEEIAEVALFFASRKVDFINGINMPVDGGITSHTGQPKY